MQFREVEEFEARALAGLPATSGWSAIPEHLAPPSGPVGLGEGERRNRPLPLRSESGTQRVRARGRDWSSATAGQALAPHRRGSDAGCLLLELFQAVDQTPDAIATTAPIRQPDA